ncbi:type II secretion system F family protein [Cellulomonas pakistanensis]|uniref:Type II secretion system protein GspF domain-containing protein n=1 Tax=Cellulomonas pakistanensis TaxID=992287 RepID=A0A919U6E9_9CELL|nr:hypothetical protein [Cellulomonas pakistanensis]GIG35967.1 hypothetical protein Cpa01nite_13480 [Cellulomonas pakistanensis]
MSGPAALVGLLVAVAVLLAAPADGSAGRRLRRADARPGPSDGGPVAPGVVAGQRSRTWRRDRVDLDAALGAAVTAVAAEVRAGRAPPEAWRVVLGVPTGADGVPGAQDVLAALGAAPARTRGASPRAGAARPADPTGERIRRRVAGVLAASRLAAELGAPVAGVLDECARSLAADAEAETAVRSALAGPRQTTTLLTWLPVLGVVLGALLGADLLGMLLDGGAGTVCGLGGVALTALGRRWVARMVADARAAGAGGAGPASGGARPQTSGPRPRGGGAGVREGGAGVRGGGAGVRGGGAGVRGGGAGGRGGGAGVPGGAGAGDGDG